MKQSKKPPRVDFRKGRKALKKIGTLKEATQKVEILEKLCRTMHIKYVITLEDQLQDDKAHLLLKERTIKTLEQDIRQKNQRLKLIEKFQITNVKKINKDWEKRASEHKALVFILREKIERLESGELTQQYKEAYEDCLKKNDEFAIQNLQLIKERDEVTRAYNSLHTMGKFCEEEGINIKEYSKKLPENNLDFEQTHKVLESGQVRSSYRFTIPKKEKKKN